MPAMPLPDRRRRLEHGFSLIEVLGALALLAVLLGIAIPMLHEARRGAALATAQEELAALVTRARWMAITSGSPRVLVVDGSRVSVRATASGPELRSLDLADYGATLSAPSDPLTFDGRGFLTPPTTTTLTLSGTTAADRTVEISPVGRVHRSS